MTNSSPLFALPKGSRIFEFEIQSVLGHGGFGITYLALDVNLQERVALKEYLPSEIAVRHTNSVLPKTSNLASDYQIGLSSFLKEARILARFRVASIVQVRRFFEYNGTGYIVLDYEDGLTLAQKLEKSGTLPEKELEPIFTQILDALEPLHERGVLHRDLKPSNIILRDTLYPVLIDFGAAKDFLSRNTRSSAAMVTEGYSPPEQYELRSQQGPWTDFYALGAIAYRCVTGEAPPESRKRLRDDPMVPARQAGARRYKNELLDTIDWMLTIDESARPNSVAAIRKALKKGSNRIATPQAVLPALVSPKSYPDDPRTEQRLMQANMVVRQSGGLTVLEFGNTIEADLLELSFHSRDREAYMAIGTDGGMVWEDRPFFFSLMRIPSEDDNQFLIEPRLASAIETGNPIHIASSDKYIEGEVIWPSIAIVKPAKSSSRMIWWIAVPAAIGLAVLLFALKRMF